MAAKKPLLPPGSRRNILEKSPERKRAEDEQPQDNGNEIAPKLFTSVSTDQIASHCSHRRPPRSSSDDMLHHDKVVSRKPLPPTPPLGSKDIKVDGTGVDSNVAQRSPTTIAKPPPPPYRERNSPQLPNKSSKPPIAPRKVHTKPEIDEIDFIDKRTKPPLPRKPRTVYGGSRTGPAVPKKHNFALEPLAPLQTTGIHRSPTLTPTSPNTENLSKLPTSPNREAHSKLPTSPNREIHFKVKHLINEANKSSKPLEKMLLTKNMEINTGAGVNDITSSVGSDRPSSMILTSQVIVLLLIHTL